MRIAYGAADIRAIAARSTSGSARHTQEAYRGSPAWHEREANRIIPECSYCNAPHHWRETRIALAHAVCMDCAAIELGPALQLRPQAIELCHRALGEYAQLDR